MSKAFFVLDKNSENWYFRQICCDVSVFKNTHCLFISITLVPRRHIHKFATKWNKKLKIGTQAIFETENAMVPLNFKISNILGLGVTSAGQGEG